VQRFLRLVNILVSFALSLFAKSDGLHHARFAHVHELTSLLADRLDETSLLLGIAQGGGVYRVKTSEKRRELGNLLAVAPTRGGKGLLAVSQLLAFQGSVIVNDIKGELFEQTAGYRQTLGPVFVIDPSGVGHRFDPLQGKSSEQDFLAAATNLLHRGGEGEGRIFTERASVMLTYLFLASRAEGYPPLAYARQLIHLGLPNAAARLNSLSPYLSTQFLDMEYNQANFEDDRFLLSSWGTLSIRLRQLLTDSIVRTFTGADFAASDIMRSERPVTVYLRLPEQDLVALAPFTRLLWQSFIGELLTTFDNARGERCRPVLLLLDEAGVTEIPNLHLYSATVAGRGISLWAAVQSLSQLDGIYGKYRADTIRNNMDTKLFYRQASVETAEYIERALGRQSGYAHSQSLHEGEETSTGLSEQAVPLMTAQDIQQLGAGHILCQHANFPPFKATRMDWRAFPALVKRRSLPPPALSMLPAPAEDLPKIAWQRQQAWPSRAIDPDAIN
jgi:type IV secretion system protein VirD4